MAQQAHEVLPYVFGGASRNCWAMGPTYDTAHVSFKSTTL